jgi:hypothetical protein
LADRGRLVAWLASTVGEPGPQPLEIVPRLVTLSGQLFRVLVDLGDGGFDLEARDLGRLNQSTGVLWAGETDLMAVSRAHDSSLLQCPGTGLAGRKHAFMNAASLDEERSEGLPAKTPLASSEIGSRVA